QLARWFVELGLGSNGYDHGLPDAIWERPEIDKRALLRGLWDGDGSWSYINGGPSVIFEYGTVSARLADGMLRLLGDVGVVAAQRNGRDDGWPRHVPVLPEGHARHGASRRGPRLRLQPAPWRDRGQRGAVRADGGEGRPGPRRVRVRPSHRGVGSHLQGADRR